MNGEKRLLMGMKKIMSLFLIAALVCFSMPCAFANDIIPVVDVDLSEYDGTAASISNAGSGSATVFALNGTTAPESSVIINEQGKQTTYLQFDSSSNGSLLITDSNAQNLSEGTVVFWVKKDRSSTNGMSYFNYGDGTTKMFGVMNQWGMEQLLVSGAGAGNYINSEWVGQWRMMALTRSYDETSKEWTIKLFPHDRSADEWVYKKTFSQDPKQNETGFRYEFGEGQKVKLANIKIYDRVLTRNELNAIRTQETSDFVPGEQSMECESSSPAEGEVDAGIGTITLHFNNYVDADTLSGITFTEATGTPVPGKVVVETKEERTKDVVIRFGDLKENTTYHLTIPNGIRSLNGFETVEETLIYTTTSNTLGGSAAGPRVITTQSSETNAATDVIYFGSDMDVSKLQTAEIYYSNDNERVNASFLSYDDSNRAVTVVLDQYLTYGRSYSLYMKQDTSESSTQTTDVPLINIKVPFYSVSMTTPIFKNALTGEIITAISAGVNATVEFTLKNSGDATNIAVILLHMSSENRIKDTKYCNVSLSANGSLPFSESVSDSMFEEGDKVKLMVWDIVNGGAKPVLMNPVVLTYQLSQ